MDTGGTYNIQLLGDSGVGKTAYISRFVTGHFITQHVPTADATYTVKFSKKWYEPSDYFYTFNIFEGESKHQSDGAIIMFDVTNLLSFQSALNLYTQYHALYPHNPIVIVGNKAEIRGRKRKVKNKIWYCIASRKIPYYDVSAKSNYNTEKPFMMLAQMLNS